MRILKILLYIILVLVALVAALGLFGRKKYYIERGLEIKTPKSLIYNYARYFKNFSEWSPWQVLDPNMTITIGGTDGMPGATYNWKGNKKIGAGTQTITAITPDQITTNIDLEHTFDGVATMSFEDKGGSTWVKWSYDLTIDFPWNGFAMLTDVDAFVGVDFQRGLENLKKVCEEKAALRYNNFTIEELDLPLRNYASIRGQTDTMPEAAMAFYENNIAKILTWAQGNNIALEGSPSGIFWGWANGKYDMAAAMSVPAGVVPPKGIAVFQAGDQKALVLEHYGPYDKTMKAHQAMDNYMADRGLTNVLPVIEEYVTDTALEKDSTKWLTKVIYFVK
jgi:effector-binding domain-containing protein